MTQTARSIRLANVEASYAPGRPILHGVSLAAAPARITVILGPNGAGKSTLLSVAAGFLKPSAGAVLLGAHDISSLPVHRRAEHGIGLLLQGRSTFPDLTVMENIELGGWPLRSNRARLRHAVETVLARYPSLHELRDRPAGSLSGGQQRMVEIARLMVPQPTILLVDEPSVGLSPIAAERVYAELLALKREGRTILLADQNVRAAVRIADYIYALSAGRNDIEGEGSTFQADPGTLVRNWLGVAG
jgi:branched-chain amino acid transport system ATP-binding protein